MNEIQDRAGLLLEQEAVGQRLKIAIDESGVRHSDVAAELNLDHTALSAVLNGRRPWRAGVVDLEAKVKAAVDAACERRGAA